MVGDSGGGCLQSPQPDGKVDWLPRGSRNGKPIAGASLPSLPLQRTGTVHTDSPAALMTDSVRSRHRIPLGDVGASISKLVGAAKQGCCVGAQRITSADVALDYLLDVGE